VVAKGQARDMAGLRKGGRGGRVVADGPAVAHVVGGGVVQAAGMAGGRGRVEAGKEAARGGQFDRLRTRLATDGIGEPAVDRLRLGPSARREQSFGAQQSGVG
ncbi:MAG: hypothetical protein ACK56I_21340, partial [bacterium]